jgi:3-hydroxybutyryl-CoA dehydrogenase
MGNGIAHVFAQHGWETLLLDVSRQALDKAFQTISANLDRQVKKGSLTAEQKEVTLHRLTTATELDGAGQAELVVEAATENPEIKFQLFRDLDAAAPKTAILASNTSSIPITAIAAQTTRAPQVIGMHFMNPVPVMQLVEVIRGLETSDETLRRTVEIATALGKTPVEVSDSPGFVANRVLMPMINEAIFCVMEGVATPQAVDTVGAARARGSDRARCVPRDPRSDAPRPGGRQVPAVPTAPQDGGGRAAREKDWTWLL